MKTVFTGVDSAAFVAFIRTVRASERMTVELVYETASSMGDFAHACLDFFFLFQIGIRVLSVGKRDFRNISFAVQQVSITVGA